MSQQSAVSFSDTPLVRQVGNVTANIISASYVNGSLVVGGTVWPTLSIAQTGTNLTLSWPATAYALTLQTTANLGGSWAAANAPTVTNVGTISLTLPAPPSAAFFRLYQP